VWQRQDMVSAETSWRWSREPSHHHRCLLEGTGAMYI